MNREIIGDKLVANWFRLLFCTWKWRRSSNCCIGRLSSCMELCLNCSSCWERRQGQSSLAWRIVVVTLQFHSQTVTHMFTSGSLRRIITMYEKRKRRRGVEEIMVPHLTTVKFRFESRGYNWYYQHGPSEFTAPQILQCNTRSSRLKWSSLFGAIHLGTIATLAISTRQYWWMWDGFVYGVHGRASLINKLMAVIGQ